MSYGIVAMGEALGEPVKITDDVIESYTANGEAVRSWGYRSFHRAGDDTFLTDLAVEAAGQALDAAAADAADIDLVVVAIADFAEYLCWDAAAAVQGRIGARRAEAVLINQACSSGVIAFDIVAGRFATHPDYQNALIVASNRICETYQNRMKAMMNVLSDGACGGARAPADYEQGEVAGNRGHQRWQLCRLLPDGHRRHQAPLPDARSARPGRTAGAQPAGPPRGAAGQ